jgi:hypothetical protein
MFSRQLKVIFLEIKMRIGRDLVFRNLFLMRTEESKNQLRLKYFQRDF